MSKMKVYISGKIGEGPVSGATREKFARASAILEAMGHDVVNPCDDEFQETMEAILEWSGELLVYDNILYYDLGRIRSCDALCLLLDWRESPGAKAELAFAQTLGKEIFELRSSGVLARWSEKNTHKG